MTNYIQKAQEIATKAHMGQVDKAGKDYINHPKRVAERLLNESENVQVVAWLHDVVEDTSVTLKDLEQIFNKEVIDALTLLTHDKSVPYMEYVEKISHNEIARKVKMSDLIDNMNLSRLDINNITNNELDRVEKYLKVYRFLLNSGNK